MWVGVEFYTILMKWCKNWCGLEMLSSQIMITYKLLGSQRALLAEFDLPYKAVSQAEFEVLSHLLFSLVMLNVFYT